ncbi:putative integral membrane protein [Diplocarpon rosae]|nr:putative integral membrane protein [Diplocarpon rosae]
MDIFRPLAIEAPQIRTFRDNKPTLLVGWWCTVYAAVVILTRFCGRYIRTEKVFLADGIMLAAIVPLFTRMALVHLVLIYGTNNVQTYGLSAQSIRDREVGSHIVLASRVFYAAYLWQVKYSTSVFLGTLIEPICRRSANYTLLCFQVFLVVTFLTTVVCDLATCHPFSDYWKVVPAPAPQCRHAFAHLMTTRILDIITNFMLVILPVPIILMSRLQKTKKASILFRLSLPISSIILTSIQLPHTIEKGGDQHFRSLIASFEILLATFTSNALVLVSLLQDRGYKKTKYKVAPTDYESRNILSQVPTTARGRGSSVWGGDADLMAGGKQYSDIMAMGVYPSKDVELDGGGARRGSKLPKEPEKAKMQEIRYAQTWEITVADERPQERCYKY